MKHECDITNAPKFADWIKNRGGVAVWKSINLSNLGASWSTPAWDVCPEHVKRNAGNTSECSMFCSTDCPVCHGTDQVPHPKPTWQADDAPKIVTDPAEIEVYESVEVKRFHVAVRMASMMLKVSDGGSRKIRREVEKAGEGAFYEFDYDDYNNCVILRSKRWGTLKEWMEKNP